MAPATIADLHIHGADSYGFEWNLPGLKGRAYSRKDVAENLLARCSGRGYPTLAGLINFDDRRAERILAYLGQLLEADFDIKSKGSFVTVNLSNHLMYFIRGQEIPTDKGHLLVVGAKENTAERKLEDALKWTKDNNALVIADHPLFSKCPSLQEADIKKYRNYFDAIETGNGYCPELWAQQEALAQRCGLPLIANSDSHRIELAFHSHTLFEALDFASADALKASIRRSLKQAQPRLVRNPHPGYEKYRHGIAVASALGLLKLGAVRRTL